MTEAQQNRETAGTGRVSALLPVALLLAAWAACAAGEYRVSRLDLSPFGRCEDVPEALARDRYVARHLLPFAGAAVFLDGLALVGLVWASITAARAGLSFQACPVCGR